MNTDPIIAPPAPAAPGAEQPQEPNKLKPKQIEEPAPARP